MERARQLVSAIIAGMLIGMGGTVYLSQSNPVIGSFLFAIGLYTIVVFQLHLFTGKIGYTPFQKPIYVIELVITWFGNLLGTGLTALMVKNSRIGVPLVEKVMGIADVKLNDNFFSIFLLAIFCGMLMFIAAEGFKTIENPVGKMLAVFLPVMAFILSGYEHCIANMFYYTVAQVWSANAFVYLLVMTLGNAVGGMFIPLVRKGFIKAE